MNTHTV